MCKKYNKWKIFFFIKIVFKIYNHTTKTLEICFNYLIYFTGIVLNGLFSSWCTDRGSIHPHSWNDSNERDTKKRGYEMCNICRLIEFNAGHWRQQRNHPILNKIYDTLAELHIQGKQITLCKVPAHIGIKGKEEANKAAKQAIDMPGMTMTKLPHTDYYLNGKTIIASYTILNHM